MTPKNIHLQPVHQKCKRKRAKTDPLPSFFFSSCPDRRVQITPALHFYRILKLTHSLPLPSFLPPAAHGAARFCAARKAGRLIPGRPVYFRGRKRWRQQKMKKGGDFSIPTDQTKHGHRQKKIVCRPVWKKRRRAFNFIRISGTHNKCGYLGGGKAAYLKYKY